MEQCASLCNNCSAGQEQKVSVAEQRVGVAEVRGALSRRFALSWSAHILGLSLQVVLMLMGRCRRSILIHNIRQRQLFCLEVLVTVERSDCHCRNFLSSTSISVWLYVTSCSICRQLTSLIVYCTMSVIYVYWY